MIHTSEPRVTKTALGSRFDDNGEVPREQEPTHVNGRTRGQQFASRATADTADSDEPEVVLDTQDAPSADHETGEQAVENTQGNPRANKYPDTSSMEATNGSEAVQDTRNQSFSSNLERGSPGSNLDTSGSSDKSNKSDPSEQ